MRAKTVNENISFERGQDPREAMGIGDEEIQMINKLDRLAKKYGFEEAPFEPQHEEEGIINIKRWVNSSIQLDDDTEIHLFRQRNFEDAPLEIYFNTGYSDGQDDAEDWLRESVWKHYFD